MKKLFTATLFALAYTHSFAQDIPIHAESLYPEGTAYSKAQNSFYISSAYHGQVSKLDHKGQFTQFTHDPELISTLGMLADDKTNTLYVTNLDLGAALKSSKSTTAILSELMAYDLKTGKRKFKVQLGPLNADHPNLVNDLTVDGNGNLYLTNSFSPIIFKINKNHEASIFARNDEWIGEGFNLNGIVYHPDGFLIVAHTGKACLYKVNIDKPEEIHKITLPAINDVDGLILNEKDEIIAICNKSNEILKIRTRDHWTSASIVDTKKSKIGFPTTGVKGKDAFYIINTRLSEMFDPKQVKSSDFLLQKVIFQRRNIDNKGQITNQ